MCSRTYFSLQIHHFNLVHDFFILCYFGECNFKCKTASCVYYVYINACEKTKIGTGYCRGFIYMYIPVCFQGKVILKILQFVLALTVSVN